MEPSGRKRGPGEPHCVAVVNAANPAREVAARFGKGASGSRSERLGDRFHGMAGDEASGSLSGRALRMGYA